MRLKCHDHGRYLIIETPPHRNCRALRQRETVTGQRSPLMRSMPSGISMNDARQDLVADTRGWTPVPAIVRYLRSHIDLPSERSRRNRSRTESNAIALAVLLFKNEIYYMTFIIYPGEMAAELGGSTSSRFGRRRHSRGEVESVSDT